MKVVIIIPTYNERENIRALIEALERAVNCANTILVVDDNSPDGTAAVVRSMMRQFIDPKDRRLRTNLTIIEGEREGLGRAYIRGIDYAIKNMNAEVIVQTDADFSHDPKDVPRLLAEIKNGYDLVIGSRYIEGGAIPSDWAFHRKVFSWGGNLLVRLLTGIWDVHEFTTSFRAYTAELYQEMNFENFNFADNTFLPAFVVEAVRVGAKIKEVPIVFTDRKKGRSKIEVCHYVPTLLKYLLTSRLRSRSSPLTKIWGLTKRLGLDKIIKT